MEQLINIENKEGVLLVSSRVVAERFGKEHKHVIDKILKLETEITSAENWADLFKESSYKDSYNRNQKEYLLTRDGFSLLAMGFTGSKALDWKLKFIEAFNKMEDQIKKIPSGQELLSLAVIEAQRVLSEKEKVIEALTPKGIFADSVAASNNTILIGEMAKILKQNGHDFGQKRLFGWLRENGYLIKRKGTDYNMPTQKSMELKLFEIKESVVTHADGHVSVNKTPKVTGKGQIYFVNKFNQRTIVAV